MKPRITRKKILIVLLVLLLAFIWGNSCLPVSLSSQESGRFLRLIRPLLEVFFGQGNVTHHLVRKLAHFTEFTALGLVVGLLTHQGKSAGLRSVVFSLVMGLLAAFADESIQMLSDRGDQIKDVWLDFSGVVLGSALSLILLSIRRRGKKRKTGGHPNL